MPLDIYEMNDQPQCCPKCGTKTDFETLSSGSQLHNCPNCRYRFYLDEPVTAGKGLKMRSVTTDPMYWDCECEIGYIHSKDVNFCRECGAWSEDQPDSRADEIKYIYGPHNDLKCEKREPIRCEWCGDKFMPDPEGGQIRFCSDSCEQTHRKRN